MRLKYFGSILFAGLCSAVTEGFTYFSEKQRVMVRRGSWLSLVPQQLGSFESLAEDILQRPQERKVILEDLVSKNSRLVNFHDSWDWQKHLMQEHVNRITKKPEERPFLSEEAARGLMAQENGIENQARP